MNLTLALRRFTIRTRMLGAIAMVLTLLVGVGGVGLWGLGQISASNERFVADTYVSTVVLAELRTAMGDVRRYEKDLLINYDSAAQQAAYRPKWQGAVDTVRARARQLATAGAPAQRDAAAQIDAGLAGYAALALPVFKTIEIGGFNDAPVANKAIDPAKKLSHAAALQIDAIAALMAAQTLSAVAEQQQAARFAWMVFAAALATAVLLVVPLTLLNMSSICRPIDQARGLAERIAAGDLSSPLASGGADETAGLLAALDTMQTSLRAIVGQVRESAQSIQVASAEVAAGNTDLSQRTEQSASSLQQTAGSLEQLTGNVRQSADAASQANQLAVSASTVARRGGDVVAQVVSTMDEINSSSKRIADIIGTIDGIAFQTNILALNAAVEAARAGEQGRGFAVVAAEVRSLAQRSTGAAREIKSLIGASVEKVETGARLVQDAGATMAEIVASVQRVTDIIGEITAAAAEQSAGIGTVNGAVIQLDQMTQQNAALVEESAAAAESLKHQAQRLADVVGRFQLGGNAPLAAQTTPVPVARPTPRHNGAAPLVSAQVRPPVPRWIAPASVAPIKVAAVASVAVAASTESSDWERF